MQKITPETIIRCNYTGEPTPHHGISGKHRRSRGYSNERGEYMEDIRYWSDPVGNKHDTYDAARDAARAMGFACPDNTDTLYAPIGTGICSVFVSVYHEATQRELDRLTDENTTTWAEAEPCYLRYGNLPESGYSYNYSDNRRESGVSVFHGQQLPDGRVRIIPHYNQELGDLLMLRAEGRPLFIVNGDEIGLGSDGEPILANCVIISEVF